MAWQAWLAIALGLAALILVVLLHLYTKQQRAKLAAQIGELRDQQAASAAIEALTELETRLTDGETPEQRVPPEAKRRKHLWIVPPATALALIARKVHENPVTAMATVGATAGLVWLVAVGLDPARPPVPLVPPVDPPPAAEAPAWLPPPTPEPSVSPKPPGDVQSPTSPGTPAENMPAPVDSATGPGLPASPAPTPDLPLPSVEPPVPFPAPGVPELPELPDVPELPPPDLPTVPESECVVELELLDVVQVQVCPPVP